MSEQTVPDPATAADDPVTVTPDPVVPPSADVAGGTTPQGQAVRAVTNGEVEVVCPSCGLTLVGESPRPTADWFCPRCDYPLFWAAEPDRPAPPSSSSARRRLPGMGGRLRLGSEPCWHCGEHNEPDDTECGRCAATLPKPLAPRVEVRVEVPVQVPVPIAVRPVVWPFVAAAGCGAAAIAAAITAWLAGGG